MIEGKMFCLICADEAKRWREHAQRPSRCSRGRHRHIEAAQAYMRVETSELDWLNVEGLRYLAPRESRLRGG